MSDRYILQTVLINELSLTPFDDKRFIVKPGIKSLPYGHADAIEATYPKTDPEWDASTLDEIQDLFEDDWENDNEWDNTLPASTESLQPPDPGFKRIINVRDLDSEDNVDFEAVIDEYSVTSGPFID